jgi:hypothetical protein
MDGARFCQSSIHAIAGEDTEAVNHLFAFQDFADVLGYPLRLEDNMSLSSSLFWK